MGGGDPRGSDTCVTKADLCGWMAETNTTGKEIFLQLKHKFKNNLLIGSWESKSTNLTFFIAPQKTIIPYYPHQTQTPRPPLPVRHQPIQHNLFSCKSPSSHQLTGTILLPLPSHSHFHYFSHRLFLSLHCCRIVRHLLHLERSFWFKYLPGTLAPD